MLDFWNKKLTKNDVAVKDAAENLDRLVRTIINESEQVIVVRYPWPISLIDSTLKDKRSSEWRDAVPDMDAVTYLELDNYLLKSNNKENQFLYADSHPNINGHKTIAKVLCDQLTQCD